jgi:hypothetical protein
MTFVQLVHWESSGRVFTLRCNCSAEPTVATLSDNSKLAGFLDLGATFSMGVLPGGAVRNMAKSYGREPGFPADSDEIPKNGFLFDVIDDLFESENDHDKAILNDESLSIFMDCDRSNIYLSLSDLLILLTSLDFETKHVVYLIRTSVAAVFAKVSPHVGG